MYDHVVRFNKISIGLTEILQGKISELYNGANCSEGVKSKKF